LPIWIIDPEPRTVMIHQFAFEPQNVVQISDVAFRSSDGQIIEGQISADASEQDVVEMLALTNKQCRATLKENSVSAHKGRLPGSAVGSAVDL